MRQRFVALLTILPGLLPAAHGSEALTRAQAEAAVREESQARLDALRAERATEMDSREIVLEGKTLKWKDRVFGEAPASGRSLWISLHGGGGAPAAVNDGQWSNQVGLYEPKEGIYLAPRAPTDTWNLWHEAHIDPLFDRLIEDHIALKGVDPNRVYVLGYSAGGDGVWQLGPRMADRWAAAAMMAGHPNEASLLGLRNLPFALFVGGEDKAYNRNTIVAARAAELGKLRSADPGGYEHLVRIYPGLPHWMNRKDAEALPWMAKHTRNPWPARIVWLQDDVTHDRFYWLALPPGTAKVGQRIDAEVKGQTITLGGDLPGELHLRLSDALFNLDLPVTVLAGNRTLHQGVAPRTREAIRASLAERADPASVATARLVIRK